MRHGRNKITTARQEQDNNEATWLKQGKDDVTWKKQDNNGATCLKHKDGTHGKKKIKARYGRNKIYTRENEETR